MLSDIVSTGHTQLVAIVLDSADAEHSVKKRIQVVNFPRRDWERVEGNIHGAGKMRWLNRGLWW